MGKWMIMAGFVLGLLFFPIQIFAATVVIDPGHGGYDPGAIGINKLKEKDVNLDISFRMRDELQKRGYTIIMTRDTDRFLTLQERIEFAERSGGDMLVSVHANAHPDRCVRGTLVIGAKGN